MFDDCLCFVAMKTLQMTELPQNMLSGQLIGILMVAIGVLLLFRPEILMFG